MSSETSSRPDLPGLVIFDCDGVLVDSERLAVELELKEAADWGMEISREEFISRYMGRSAGLFIEDLQDHIGRRWTEAEHQAHQDMFREKFELELGPVDGVVHALDRLPARRCVASSSTLEALAWKLAHCGLSDRFEGVFSGQQVRHGKPAPDLFLFAADQLGVPASECVVVEDSGHGVNAARAAGMHVFAFYTGMLNTEQLDGPGTTIFDDMRQLPELISSHWSRRHAQPAR